MDEQHRGAILSRLMTTKAFNAGTQGARLVILAVVANTAFDEEEEWGMCTLSISELHKLLYREIASDKIDRALWWGDAQRFIRLSDRTSGAVIYVRRIKERSVHSGPTEPADKTPKSNAKSSYEQDIDKKASNLFLIDTKIPYRNHLTVENFPLNALHHTVHRILGVPKLFIACSQKYYTFLDVVHIGRKTVENPVHNSKNRKIAYTVKDIFWKILAHAGYILHPIPPIPHNEINISSKSRARPFGDCSQLGDSERNKAPAAPLFLMKMPKTKLLTKENGITPQYVNMLKTRFLNINVDEEISLLDSKLQSLGKRHNPIRSYQQYVYKCLETTNSKKEGLGTTQATVSPFICLERMVTSCSVPALYWENGVGQNMIDQSLIPFLLGSQQESQTWMRECYNQNLSKIATEASLQNLRQPTTVHQTITCFLRRPSKLLTIVGPSGTGKSFISLLATREMFRRKIPFKYISASELHKLSTTRGSAAIDMRQQLLTVPLLVVEDVLFEIKHYAFVEILCSVLNYRLKRDCLSTILTSRLRPALLLEPLGETLANTMATEPWIVLK